MTVQALSLMYDDRQYSPFCTICCITPPQTEAFPKTCSRCGSPTLAINFKDEQIELGFVELNEMLLFGPKWLLLEHVAVPYDPMSERHLEPYKATGTFEITAEHCRGHFKNELIFPGALMMEAANQTFAALALVVRKHLGFGVVDSAAVKGMVVGIDSCRFKGMVVPRNIVTMSITVTRLLPKDKRDGRFIVFKATGTVGNVKVYSANHTCYLLLADVQTTTPFNGIPTQAPELFGVPSDSGGKIED